MLASELTGALNGLKMLDIADLGLFQAAVQQDGKLGWSYYYPHLLTQCRPGRQAVLFIQDEGSICLFRWQAGDVRPRLDLYNAPTPMNVRVVKRCIERANDFNGDLSARILRIDEKDVDALSAAEIYATQRKTQYIYSPSSYNELGGKKFYTIRRNVSLIEKLPDVQVLPYSAAHKDACLALLKRWGKIHREVHKTKGGLGTSRRAIDLASVLPESVLRGQVVLVDGHLSAFAFGGEIRPGVACSFERKCESALRGLSYFQLRSFLLSFQDYTYVNDGSDAGRTGLRQLKESFRPIMKHVEFRGTQHKSALR